MLEPPGSPRNSGQARDTGTQLQVESHQPLGLSSLRLSPVGTLGKALRCWVSWEAGLSEDTGRKKPTCADRAAPVGGDAPGGSLHLGVLRALGPLTGQTRPPALPASRPGGAHRQARLPLVLPVLTRPGRTVWSPPTGPGLGCPLGSGCPQTMQPCPQVYVPSPFHSPQGPLLHVLARTPIHTARLPPGPSL